MTRLEVAALLIVHAGLSLLLLTMSKHRKQVLPRRRQLSVWHGRLAGVCGWLCLLVALSACVIGLGLGVGVPLWFGLLSLAALILILQLAYVPLQANRIAFLSLSLGLTGLVLQ